ncbi:MAG TPA: hypothetical protein VFZ97_09885 [Acidimicrobiales bacterium]
MGSTDMDGNPSAQAALVREMNGKLEAGSATGPPVRKLYEDMSEPTLGTIWHAASATPITDRLLEWPPDVFALTNVVLTRAEAFRYALSVEDWPPSGFGEWAEAVEEAGRRWSAWAEDRSGALPDLVAAAWKVFCEGADVSLEQLATRREHRLREALLTLHAIADEACIGLGVALDSSHADGCVYRARGRELLARTGSLARIDARVLRVLPKVITPPTGRLAFSRYVCVQGPGIDAHWHKIPARHRGTDLRSEYATLLLLPWPLRVQASDFHPVGDVRRRAKDPYGFFEFAPAEGLDLDLLDRVLVAARQEAGSVDVVLLPESAVGEDDIDDVETLLDRHGVVNLIAGVRQTTPHSGQFPNNWLHMGFNPRLEKGGRVPSEGHQPWFHIRQNKHHRWSLDEDQVEQYHLGGALHPHIRWWEAMDVPRKEIQFVEVAELVLTTLVCEDLAHNDEIAQLIRSVGPTLVMNMLLDGPQLPSRWTARYASVLADDPGSAVLTLTSYGMVERSRPVGRDASRVIALWKDPTRGVREIPLEPGAQGVLLTICMDRATRYSADGRWPIDNSTSCYGVAVRQVHAANNDPGPGTQRSASTAASQPVLELDELTILTAWAEGVSEAAAYAPEGIDRLLAAAGPGSTWRAELRLPEPAPSLAAAIESLGRVVRAAPLPAGATTFDALLSAATSDHAGATTLDAVARRALLSMLEERRTRQPTQASVSR